jgi:hypothetical protein
LDNAKQEAKEAKLPQQNNRQAQTQRFQGARTMDSGEAAAKSVKPQTAAAAPPVPPRDTQPKEQYRSEAPPVPSRDTQPQLRPQQTITPSTGKQPVSPRETQTAQYQEYRSKPQEQGKERLDNRSDVHPMKRSHPGHPIKEFLGSLMAPFRSISKHEVNDDLHEERQNPKLHVKERAQEYEKRLNLEAAEAPKEGQAKIRKR